MQTAYQMTKINLSDKELSLINKLGLMLKRIANVNTNPLAEKEKDITGDQNKQAINFRTTVHKSIFDNDGI